MDWLLLACRGAQIQLAEKRLSAFSDGIQDSRGDRLVQVLPFQHHITVTEDGQSEQQDV